MNLPHDTEHDSEAARPVHEKSSGMTRRSFFTRATVAGATSAVALGGLVRLASGLDLDADAANHKDDHGKYKLAKGDRDILVAAEIAEALAVTPYSNIINAAPFFDRLPFGRPRLSGRCPAGGDVPLSSRAIGDRSVHFLHFILLSKEYVRGCANYVEHSRYAGGRIHR